MPNVLRVADDDAWCVCCTDGRMLGVCTLQFNNTCSYSDRGASQALSWPASQLCGAPRHALFCIAYAPRWPPCLDRLCLLQVAMHLPVVCCVKPRIPSKQLWMRCAMFFDSYHCAASVLLCRCGLLARRQHSRKRVHTRVGGAMTINRGCF